MVRLGLFRVSKSLLFLAVFLCTLGGSAQAGIFSVASAAEPGAVTLLASGIVLWTLASLLGKRTITRMNVLAEKKKETKMNKKITLAFLALLAVAVAPAFAQSATGSLTVQSSVANNCRITAATLNFGAYDPVVAHAAADLDGSQGLTVNCTKGTNPTSLDLDLGSFASGAQRRMASGAERLNYELYRDAGRTLVWGSGASGVDPDASASKNTPLVSGAAAIVVYGRIPQNQDVAAGAYSDTVTITVNF
ncbi:MAG: Csu type fimbrial protein [Candidatus Binatia bacterium]